MTTNARHAIRIGAVSYLNAKPLVYGFEHESGDRDRYELSYAVPSALSDRMAAGELDVALLPVVELARQPELEVVPGLGITTCGPARSVLLVSEVPPEEVRRVALDPESRTTNILVQVLFDRVWGHRPEFVRGEVDLDRALGCADATVRIGDKALFEPLPPERSAYDLGEAWTGATGLPFVFAVWAARPGVVDRDLYHALHRSRRAGSNAIDRIAEEFDWNGRRAPRIAREYLRQDIRYRLGGPEVRAMNLLFEVARELELIERVPIVRMALERWTTCHESAAARTTPRSPEV